MIKGFQGISLIDYPGHVASIIFVGSCNFRCPFCHNPELVLPERLKLLPDIDEDEIIEKLKKRKKMVDGVEITGGEPTLYRNLINFLKRLKEEVQIDVKIDTNGSNPGLLQRILDEGLCDYVAMDIKSSPPKYSKACGVNVNLEAIKRSVEIIKEKAPDYEFRTTVVPCFVEVEDIPLICEFLGKVKRYILQRYQKGELVDPSFSFEPYPDSVLQEMLSKIECAEEKLIR
ncbi:MAG: anaerobic ribonucleoside-triphosphate reductase activating protein [Candidatus Hydrothermota bacterium]|nr:MAG: anaerobic ribonucleoside-triphosphate reductase activating protein [Candidatus Hydrothermae bacterium]